MESTSRRRTAALKVLDSLHKPINWMPDLTKVGIHRRRAVAALVILMLLMIDAVYSGES